MGGSLGPRGAVQDAGGSGGGGSNTPPQPEHPPELPVPRWCRREADERRRETLEQRGETRVLEQRSPWGLVRAGRLGQPLAQHLLPYARTLPLPLFAPPDLRGAKAAVARTLSRSLSHEAQRG
uniref:TELT protein n=1 Tax=Apteryx owenii TaxID=8824 RepID=A0A8B9P1B0_APTOW